ncbi:MAG: DNA-binding protein WhiA [Chloroflexota bacterium]
MSGTERDLVAALRAEVAAVDPSRACDRTAEIAGLGPSLVTREVAVARLAIRLGGRAATTRPHAVRRTISLPEAAFEWERSAEHCRLAWLRGRFLARGSLSLAAGRAHLEFVVAADEAQVLADRLADVGLPASWRLRRGLGVVTWKSEETISAFFGRIGASAALLELEARGVARSLRGELNRVINAESANLQRSVAAAGRQLAAIDLLDEDGRLQEQPRTVRAVAEARRETPEASLSEIATRLELHRSAVQRALDRLERLALHDDEGIGQRYRHRPSGTGGMGRGGRRSGRASQTGGPRGTEAGHAPLA